LKWHISHGCKVWRKEVPFTGNRGFVLNQESPGYFYDSHLVLSKIMSFFHTDYTKIDCIQDCDTASPDSTTSTLIYQDHQVKHEVLDDGLHKLVALQTPII